jgi:hypothetical protein
VGLLSTVKLFPIPPLESVLMLYCTLVTSEYASVAWNSVTRADASNLERMYCTLVTSEYASVAVTRADASNLERIQRKFLSLCLYHFPNHLQYNYVKVSNFLNSRTLSVTRSSHLAAPFLIKFIVYDG